MSHYPKIQTNKYRFTYRCSDNTVWHSFDPDREVDKFTFSRFISDIARPLGYTPSSNCDEHSAYALQKRAFFRWLISKHDIPSFAMVHHIFIDEDGWYSIEFASVMGNLK